MHRSALALLFVFFSMSLFAACNGDDSSSSGSTSSGLPPSGCAEPCNPGAQCFQPAEGTCNGVWYCWSDTKWHCAPPGGSSPGDGGGISSSGGAQGQDATTAGSDGSAEASSSDASGG